MRITLLVSTAIAVLTTAMRITGLIELNTTLFAEIGGILIIVTLAWMVNKRLVSEPKKPY